jgi:hypothetical protein
MVDSDEQATRERGSEVTEGPKYPSVLVSLGDLNGSEGNAYVILGRVKEALTRAEQTEDADPGAAAAFFAEATSGDYENLLATVEAYVVAYVDEAVPALRPLSEYAAGER